MAPRAGSPLALAPPSETPHPLVDKVNRVGIAAHVPCSSTTNESSGGHGPLLLLQPRAKTRSAVADGSANDRTFIRLVMAPP
jgi:hypothetical protein